MIFPRVMPMALVIALSAASGAAAQESGTAARDAALTGWVVIPVDQYNTLRARAYPPDPRPLPPPAPAVITRIDYDLEIAGDSAAGSATLVVDVLKDGWVEVRTPSPRVLVRDARIDGRPLPLVNDQPHPHVLLSKRGRSVIAMRVVVPLDTDGDAESVTIPGLPAALTQASIRIPRGGVDLRVANGFVSEATENDGWSRWTAIGRSGEDLTLTWRRRADDRRAEQPLRFRGSVTELVGLGEEATLVTAAVRIDVAAGVARSVDVALPEGFTVNQVAGALVADWEPQPADGLRVSFVEPVERAAAFTVSGELRGPREGDVSVPLLRLPEAERESGGVAVEVLGAGEMLTPRAQALDPADASDLGDVVAGRASPSMLAFRYKPVAGSVPRTLTLQVSRYETQAALVANIEEARYQALVAEDGKVLVRARYAIRNNRRSLLTVQLPSGAALWSTSVAGRTVRPGRSPSDAVLVPLEKERVRDEAPPFVVELVYLARISPWTARGEARMELPALDLPISRTGLVLHHSPRYRVTPVPGTFRVEPYVDPISPVLRAAAALPAPPPPPEAAASAAKTGEDQSALALQQLADEFSKDAGRRIAGLLPVSIPFPQFGPAVFLASELTPETRALTLGLEYQRQRGE